ncbi:MAG: hypothetical protein HS116_10800 [Planctomycetes bacterium]|nr:hypothetical protein [Planctomycetota bacterium]
MSVKFRCPLCERKIRVRDEYAGKRGGCPNCKKQIDIPAASTLDENDQPIGAAEPSDPPPVEAPTAVAEVEEVSPEEAAKLMQKKKASASASHAPKVEAAAFITFQCPNCQKPAGFPANMAQQPAMCPACRARVMVPARSGEASFLVGAVPKAARAAGSSAATPAVDAPKEREKIPLKWIGIGGGIAAAVMLGILLGRGGTNAPQAAQAPESPPASPTAPKPAEPHSEPPHAQTPVLPAPESKAVARSEAAPQVPEEPQVATVGPATPPPTEPAAPAVVAEAPKTVDPASALMVKDRPPARSKLDEEMDPDEEPAVAVAPPRSGPPAVEPPALNDPAPLPETDPKAPAPVPEVKPAPKVAPPPEPAKPGLAAIYQPILPPRAFVHLESEVPPPPQAWIPWMFQANYTGSRDPKVLLDEAKASYETVEQKHRNWETITGMQLVRVDTHHITVHAQLPEATAKNVGLQIEQLTNLLQQQTRSIALTPTRPHTHEILILWDEVGYNKLIDAFEKQVPGEHWKLARQSTGGMSRNLGYFNSKQAQAPGPHHMALFQFAKQSMLEATDGQAPAWLSEGFAALCENMVTQKNLVYSFRYEANAVKFGENWDQDIRKFALQSKLKTWDLIFPLDLIGMGSLDYLTCYSMVSYLYKSDNQRFIKLVDAIRAGRDSQAAVEEAYGRKLAEIQAMWGQWAMRGQ